MSNSTRFGFFPNFYLGTFLLVFLAVPFLFLMPWKHHDLSSWLESATGTTVLLLFLLLANRQCSWSNFSYREGLLFVTGSMMTGWTYLSVALVFPALLISVLASFVLSMAYLPFGGKLKSAPMFHKVVSVFYKNRMRQ